MATYKRRHLLERSLWCYAGQNFPRNEFELVVVDDHGNDGTRETVLDWSKETGIRATVLTVAPKPAEWADCGWVLNAGIRASSGRFVLLTHPEVMPGASSVGKLVGWLDNQESDRRMAYAACKVYYLSPRDQERLDGCPWRSEGVLAVRKIPEFYDEPPDGNSDYTHAVTDQVGKPGFRLRTWDSWVFGGCSRSTWARLGGMFESVKWGSVDVLFNHRRKHLGMAEWTCPDDDSIVVHQNHDLPGDVPTPRDMPTWQKECAGIDLSPPKLCYPECDFLGWSKPR